MPDITLLPDLVTPAIATDGLVTYDSSKAEGSRITEIKFSNDASEYFNGQGGWTEVIVDPDVKTVNAATYNLLTSDDILHVTYTSTGSCTVTWPTAQILTDRLVWIKDAGGNAGTNNITVATEGSQTIDGESTYVIDIDYAAVALYCDGSNLFVLTISGAAASAVTTVNSSTYSLLATDARVNVTYTATGACTITWPTAQVTDGREVVIKDAGGNASVNNITIVTGGSETIDGAASYTMTEDYSSMTILSNGSNLFII